MTDPIDAPPKEASAPRTPSPESRTYYAAGEGYFMIGLGFLALFGGVALAAHALLLDVGVESPVNLGYATSGEPRTLKVANLNLMQQQAMLTQVGGHLAITGALLMIFGRLGINAKYQTREPVLW